MQETVEQKGKGCEAGWGGAGEAGEDDWEGLSSEEGTSSSLQHHTGIFYSPISQGN